MPYISPEEQAPYKMYLDNVRAELAGKPKGHLTYVLFVLARAFWQDKGKSYTNISEAVGALGDAEAELRRQDLDPYEDVKKSENGDAKL